MTYEPIAEDAEEEIPEAEEVIMFELDEPDEPEPAQSTRPAQPTTKAPVASSGFGAGIIDLGDVEDSEEETSQKAILDDLFVAPEQPFVEPEEAKPTTMPTSEIIVDGDDEFVEFEVEDLEPSGKARPRRRPQRESRDGADSPVSYTHLTLPTIYSV